MRWLPGPEDTFAVSDVCRNLAKRGFGSLTVGRFVRKSSLFRTASSDALLPEGFQQIRFRLTPAGQRAWNRAHGRPEDARVRHGRRSRRAR